MHLAEVGESYFEHMRFALVVGALAAGAGFACMLHAIIPALCEQSCSRTVKLLQGLFADRGQLDAVVAQSSGVLVFVVLVALSFVTALVVAFCTSATAIGLVVIPQAFALPLIYLSQNKGLDPLAE
ncbi:MAG: DUF6356 family protein [Sphingomonas sp.]